MAMGVPLPMESRCMSMTSMQELEEPQNDTRRWYFSSREIEECSPSRKDGVDAEKEAYLRKSYCSFLQKLGMQLKRPQVTIACAMMLCHRFYMRQSHAKNDWQTIATASMFLAGKNKETPRLLQDVVIMAYEMIYQWDPSASRKIREKELLDKQKDLIVTAERLILATIAYDFNIELPYNPLMAAVKKLQIDAPLVKIAWNFVNDWLPTTLCLQYKAHYIAAGSLFLAAKFQKVKLPTEKGNVWWSEFEISPKQLEEVIHDMLRLLKQDKNKALFFESKSVTQATGSSAEVATNVSSLQVQPSRSRASNDSERDELSSKSKETDRQESTRKDALPSRRTDTGSLAVNKDCDRRSQPRIEKTDQNQNENQNRHNQIVSSRAYSHREEVQVRRDFPRQPSYSSRSGSVEDNRIIRAEFHHKARIETFSVYHTSSKIYANQIGDALRKRKGDWDRTECDRNRNWRSSYQNEEWDRNRTWRSPQQSSEWDRSRNWRSPGEWDRNRNWRPMKQRREYY